MSEVPQQPLSRAAAARCANCSALLNGQWCSKCGQQASPVDPTWHDLVHESIHEFLNLDSKIFRTARKLFLQPGEITAEFLRGRRAPYIGALRLYLTFSVLFFLLSAALPNPNPDRQPGSEAVPTSAELAIETHLEHTLSTVLPKMVFVMVPVFAMLLKLAYRRERRNYPQFLYFSLHFHAAAFGFLVLTVPLQMRESEAWLKTAQACVLTGMLGYLVVALHRVFGGTVLTSVLRAAAVSLTYLVVLTTATLLLILVLSQDWR